MSLFQVPQNTVSGSQCDSLIASEMGKERARARTHIDTPITRNGLPRGEPGQLERVIISTDQFTKSGGQFLPAPFVCEQEIVVGGCQVWRHEIGLIIVKGGINVRARSNVCIE